jgi:hypothetical protein
MRNLDYRSRIEEDTEVEEVYLDDLIGMGETQEPRRRFAITDYHFHISAAAFAVALIALIIAIVAVGQGDPYEEKPRSESSLRNELARKLPDELNVRNITVLSGSDGVTAEVVFFPQTDIRGFARDCRAVLNVMATQNVTYDEIVFTAVDSFTNIRAELSGRFSMDISIDEIIAITHFFGIIEGAGDVEDLEDIDN